MKWSTKTAQQYAEQGRIEEWVDAYLRAGKWANVGLADGLNKAPRWWIGPVSVPLDEMIQTCGPTAGMKYQETKRSWEHKTQVISQSLAEPSALPPVILESNEGALYLRDGNHRHGVAQEKDWKSMSALIWFNSEEEMLSSRFYKEKQPSSGLLR